MPILDDYLEVYGENCKIGGEDWDEDSEYGAKDECSNNPDCISFIAYTPDDDRDSYPRYCTAESTIETASRYTYTNYKKSMLT